MSGRRLLYIALVALASLGGGCHHKAHKHFAAESLLPDLEWSLPPIFEPQSAGPPVPAASQPYFVPVANSQAVWEAVVDVVDDFFRIRKEQPVRQEGDVLVEGQIETYPLTGASFFEPWHGDSVGVAERMESTLQSIRRIGYVKVIPQQAGYLVDVRVDKELEDLPRPENATSGPTTLRYDQSPERIRGSLTQPPPTLGWIPQGRDVLLEQKIIRRLHRNLQPLVPR